MCSVNEEYDEAQEFIPEENSQVLDGAVCQKCNAERAQILLRGKDVYCNTCFLASATHKFRATLGKSKIVRPTDKILVAYSGNGGSTALLHLIRAGMQASVHKRLVFETKVLYIDDGAVKGQSLEERKTRLQGIKRQVNALEFEAYALSLNQSIKGEELNITSLENLSSALGDFSSDDESLKNIFAKLPDYTSKVELLHKLRQKLIFSSARKLGCNKIFVADDLTSLAISILSNVSLGRGAQLSLDVSFIDNRYSDLMLLRPMRDFSRHELASYLDIHNLESIDSGDLADSAKTPQSIQRLTEKFVTDLDSKFHGTVSTVFRTGEKVCAGASTKNRNSDETCVLCDAPLDTLASDTVISAIQATAFSRLVSSQGPNGNINLGKVEQIANLPLEQNENSSGCGNCNGTGSCGKANKDVTVSSDDLRKFLCYGCRLIFKNRETDNVPLWVLNAVRERLSLEIMREEITDFLL